MNIKIPGIDLDEAESGDGDGKQVSETRDLNAEDGHDPAADEESDEKSDSSDSDSDEVVQDTVDDKTKIPRGVGFGTLLSLLSCHITHV